MWDLIVSVPDHCLSFYFPRGNPPVSTDCIASKDNSKEHPGSDLKAKEKSLKTWEQDLNKREQQLSDNVKQLASVRSKLDQQEHVINELENFKKILETEF